MTALRRLHVGALALVLAAGAGALGLRSLDTARPVSVDQAVESFRKSQASPGAAPTVTAAPTPSATATGGAARSGGKPGAPRQSTRPGAPAATAGPRATASAPAPERTGYGLPPEGVYVYATTGYETGSAGPAMNARHDYPAQTTLTATNTGDCTKWRWEPVEDRWDDITECLSGGATSQVKVYDSYHRFFGVSERMTYECTGDSWFRPPTTRAGFTWEFDCASDRARTHTEARVIGVERVTYGGVTADALHFRYDTTMTGAAEGTNPVEFWIALDGPYLLRKTGRVDAKVHTSAGTLDYHEEYDTRLTSRTPRT